MRCCRPSEMPVPQELIYVPSMLNFRVGCWLEVGVVVTPLSLSREKKIFSNQKLSHVGSILVST